jgi:hypothetical protein
VCRRFRLKIARPSADVVIPLAATDNDVRNTPTPAHGRAAQLAISRRAYRTELPSMSRCSFAPGRWLPAISSVFLVSPVGAQPPPADPPTMVTEPAAAPASCPPADNPFAKVPPVRGFSRPGHFPIPPAGPGYYSLAEALTGNGLEKPPKYPYPRFGLMPPSFFDADFRYLDDPKNTESDVFDPLKRIRVGDDWLFSTGGSVWDRYHSEYNSRLTNTDNAYNLARARVYGDLWYKDQLRVYAEFIGAWTSNQDLPPLGIDQTGPDFLNLFVDAKLFDLAGKPVYARVGRQELLFGSQRLISTLDWANTRRTFQGVRAFRASEKLDVDAFWVQPVVTQVNRLDWADNQVNFAGVWGTYKPKPGTALDGYALVLDNGNPIAQQGITRGPYSIATFGGRFAGDQDTRYLWDFEGAVQLGNTNAPGGRAPVVAGMATAGLGYHWKDAPLSPTVWLYYDYASGDRTPNRGNFGTFNPLFPFGHYYLGWADVIGRQNIHDINVQYYMYPAKWLTVYLQYHRFYLDSRTDALYSVGGAAFRRDPTGAAGNDVGREFDTVVNFHLTRHADVLVGYSHLFGGDFLKRTTSPARGVDTSVFFVQTSYRW